ncbi:MAG: GNAT family N-acetyltransferase [Ilumatobacteraceae bacterium]
MSITVHDNPDQHRFEIEVDGELAGIAEYHRSESHIVFPHTETRTPFGGRGLGTVLVKAALDAVREEGLGVQPQCWFVRDYIASHPDEYLALVAPEDRAAFGLPSATPANRS